MAAYYNKKLQSHSTEWSNAVEVCSSCWKVLYGQSYGVSTSRATSAIVCQQTDFLLRKIRRM